MQGVAGRVQTAWPCKHYRPLNSHGWVQRVVIQPLSYVVPRASLLKGVEPFEKGRDASAADVPVSSRRNSLRLLAGSALALAIPVTFDWATPSPATAALKDYNFDPNAPIDEVSVDLGTVDGEYAFLPSTLEFTAGRVTKLKLRNPSISTHYFTAFEFAEKVFSILVLAGDPAVEVKGGIQELALKAGASATWVFIPIKPGRYPLRCTIKGHDAMVGQIIIKRAE